MFHLDFWMHFINQNRVHEHTSIFFLTSQEVYTLMIGIRHSLSDHVVGEAKITSWYQNSSWRKHSLGLEKYTELETD